MLIQREAITLYCEVFPGFMVQYYIFNLYSAPIFTPFMGQKWINSTQRMLIFDLAMGQPSKGSFKTQNGWVCSFSPIYFKSIHYSLHLCTMYECV